MKYKKITLPRILKIESIEGFMLHCIFNNGETRVIDFKTLFASWKLSEKDPEYFLLKETAFKKVTLRNQTLSWPNVKIKLQEMDGSITIHPYELSPDMLFKVSQPVTNHKYKFALGTAIKHTRIKKGLTQQELATLSGTSKTYISRIENNRIEPGFSTLYKIVEVGLGKKVKLEIC